MQKNAAIELNCGRPRTHILCMYIGAWLGNDDKKDERFGQDDDKKDEGSEMRVALLHREEIEQGGEEDRPTGRRAERGNSHDDDVAKARSMSI